MQSTRTYQICTRCILSTADDPLIYFDNNGVCNHCHLYDKEAAERLLPLPEREKYLEKLIEEIKLAGKNKAYDCIVGVSGGVDSTYVAYLVKQYGLRPLAVHCDNGWNSELAVSNISNILKKLNIDLYTKVINWEEFKNLQLAYLKASVIDIEATSDHAIFATLYHTANKYGIKYILSGENFRTEGILPERWIHNKNDLINIKAINKRFGVSRLKTFPKLGLFRKYFYEKIKGIKYVKILDLFYYNRKDAKEILTSELNWRDYGGKHYESIITRFYQSYILPVKFHVDKRRSHLSTMICSGQITREEALIESAKPLISAELAASDKEYVLKKFGLSTSEFERIISAPEIPHTAYPSIINFFNRVRFITRFLKRINLWGGSKVYLSKVKGKKVAMLLDNSYLNDNRVIQEATTVGKYFDLTMFCMYSPDLPFREVKNEVKIERIIPRDIFRFQSYGDLKMVARRIASYNFDVIHCHDHLMLNIGAMIKKLNPKTVLIYDSHELFHSWPLNFTTKNPYIIFKSLFVRKIQIRNEKKFGREIDYLVTVNQSLADNLQNYFRLKTKPTVIRNVPVNELIPERNYILRNKFDIPDNKKILAFIGAHIYLESLNMVQVLNEIGNKDDLIFIIISSDDEHRKQVEDYAKKKNFTNVLFHDVVPHHQITTYLSGCDAGIVPTWNKKDLSYWYALDNKLFNYLMAEIPMLSTAQPEYKAIVEKYNIGVCVNPDEPGAYYNGWKEIIKNKELYTTNLVKAKQVLNWTNESKLLINFYDQLLERKNNDEVVINELPRIAMLLDNSFTMDSRVYREAKTLVNNGYQLTLYAVQRNDLPAEEIKDGILIRRIFSTEIFDLKNAIARSAMAQQIAREPFDILHCHDQLMLYIGTLIKKQRPETLLVYDSHELFHSWPINYSSHSSPWVRIKTDVVRKLEVNREKKAGKLIDRVITVSKSIGNDLEKYFELKNKVVIIRNLAEYEEIVLPEKSIRQELGISAETKIVLNFSLFIYWKSRNIEVAIEQFANKPGVALIFICGEGGNKKEIMKWVSESGFKNIYFHSAIQPGEIVKTIQAADYGLLSTWNKKYMSYWLGLENKLFHYVMAELPILASAQPEHMEIIEQHKIGVCVNADEPNAYYNGFLELEKRNTEFKNNVRQTKKILNWEHEQNKLLDLYKELKEEFLFMPVADFNIVVTDKAPVNIDEWNLLSFRCNNIWQSTFNDEIQLYFNNWPWYFQCYHQEKLIGGVKIYFYESKKLPAFIRTISTRATQGSEILVDDSKNIEFSKLYFELTAAIKKWLKKKQITSFYSYSFFGETEKLISLIEYKKIWESRIGIAKIDLTKSIDELRKAINPKHRSEIFKAVRNNVTIEFVNDIDLFFLLLDETYKNQNAHPPNKNFIRNEYEIFKSNHSAQLVFAKQNGNYLCGALLYNYGKSSLYNFGGTIKNSIGAGQFLHWEIMKYLKVNGFQNYFLGETSLELSESNLKFSKGISKFKLRFGAQQLPTQHTGYALKPVQLKFWNLLKRLFIGQ